MKSRFQYFNKGTRLWGIWSMSLLVGIYGMSKEYEGITGQSYWSLLLGSVLLLVSYWTSGSILSSAIRMRRKISR